MGGILGTCTVQAETTDKREDPGSLYPTFGWLHLHPHPHSRTRFLSLSSSLYLGTVLWLVWLPLTKPTKPLTHTRTPRTHTPTSTRTGWCGLVVPFFGGPGSLAVQSVVLTGLSRLARQPVWPGSGLAWLLVRRVMACLFFFFFPC